MKVQLDWLRQYVEWDMSKEDLCHLLTMGGLEVEADEPVDLGSGKTTEVVELNVTPNRGYCLSHLGVAREIAGFTGAAFRSPEPDSELEKAFTSSPAADALQVENEETGLCPRYAALVIDNVKVAPSPQWLQERLIAIGLRPINNIVDITNFVMMEYGQPLHAFDLNLLKNRRILIRRGGKQEAFVALDGTQLRLDPDALVIADGEKPIALAGIMGGANSQVTKETTTVALESAYFDPVTVRQASKKYGLRSDSSYRFERGVDIEAVITAQSRAALLIRELAGGEILNGRFDIYPNPVPRKQIALRVSRTNQVLGTAFEPDKIFDYLRGLGLEIVKEEQKGERVLVEVPAFRPTLQREIDLIEEIARLDGYDQVPVTSPRGALSPVIDSPTRALVQEARARLCHLGYAEAVNYSFIEKEYAANFMTAFAPEDAGTIDLDNPISADLGTMRTSLVPGLLKTAISNINKGNKSVRLFETGSIFHQPNGGQEAVQNTCIAVLAAGPHPTSVWKGANAAHDFFDIKGVLESLLDGFGVKAQTGPATRTFLDAGQSAAWTVEDREIAYCGKVEGKLTSGMGLDTPAFALEIHVGLLAEVLPGRKKFQPLPKFPETYRDISILVDKPVASGEISDLIREAGQPLLSRVELYDQFEGKKLPEGKKSLTYALAFQSPDKTLTDEEVNPVFQNIVKALDGRVGATLRDQ
ncbi:putative Phenylalanyl-tRNA synthetase beta chain [Nitrospina gracilis 3/211]|uniref:Phenylalanine--tRNA ligase beta subunit n=1 Tax=Nitrospina gracilis (strain 3/211) TaxID=1266370 RepID=M1YVE4_NITG3|nr:MULTISPECIES: phenylalanine--tRNA ligase subunit beta [Nitrospina]MCF8722086.1 phenylalanyl-tRNA synthetase beta chain [Nitrospina sp. Nb-3]CCQ89275.1 putative Phenylalanyl-tRNA synthetase beta chain [Nitrospina gracilis 3/211]